MSRVGPRYCPDHPGGGRLEMNFSPRQFRDNMEKNTSFNDPLDHTGTNFVVAGFQMKPPGFLICPQSAVWWGRV